MKFLFFILLSIASSSLIFAQDKVFEQTKVMAYFQNQEFEEAIRYLLPFSLQDTSNTQLLGYVAYAYHMSDQLKSAANYYEKILTIDSQNISANQNLANLYSNKNPDTTQFLTSRLIRLQPGKALHYRSMGNLYDRKKEKDSALKFYEAAYQISPDDPRNIASFADILLDVKNYNKADSIISLGLSHDSLYVPLLVSAIRLAYETENYEQTIVPGERLIRLGEVTLKPLTQLILSYYTLSRYQECIAVCNYLKQQEIITEAVNYYEAKAWAKLGKFDQSNELLRLCIESAISERAEMYYSALADNYETTGFYVKAIAHYDTAYYLFRDPVVKYNLGRIYETRMKNPMMANKYFKSYLSMADTSTRDEKKIYRYLHERYRSKKNKN
jgi:tetratricopeptide (TPR) repeat protein